MCILNNKLFESYLLFLFLFSAFEFFFYNFFEILLFVFKLKFEKNYNSKKNLANLDIFGFIFIIFKLIFFIISKSQDLSHYLTCDLT